MKGKDLPQQVKTMLHLITATYGDTFDKTLTKTIAIQQGFEILETCENKKTGYYGIAFISQGSDGKNLKDEEENIIYVVHRGTDSVNTTKSFSTVQNVIKNLDIVGIANLISSLTTDIVNDFYLATGEIPPQVEIALNFLDNIKKSNPQATVIQLGHSLGGCITELCYVKNNGDIESYAFESAGSMDIVLTHFPEDIKSLKAKPIHHYNGGPNFINTCMQHYIGNNPDSSMCQLIFPIEERMYTTTLLGYLKMSFILHTGMLYNIDSISYIDVANWPVGIQKGLQHFFSKANNAGWYTMLATQWEDICAKSGISDNKEEFDKFLNYFANRYLNQSEDSWQQVLPVQNLGQTIKDYQEFPIYKKVVFIPLAIAKSLWASAVNYHHIDSDLASKYLQVAQEPSQGILSKSLNKAYDLGNKHVKGVTQFLKDSAQFAWQNKCFPVKLPSSLVFGILPNHAEKDVMIHHHHQHPSIDTSLVGADSTSSDISD